MNPFDRRARKFILDFFLEHAFAPAVEEVARGLSSTLPEARAALARLEEAHHMKLLEGTSRILMVFPFSAVSSPYRVTRSNGKRYFANCAWDSIAFHPMLGEPVRIDSFCDRCAEPIRFHLKDGRGVPTDGPLPLVRLSLPASEWWTDITRTCSNTMVFIGSEESDPDTLAIAEGGLITVDQVVQMSVPIYRGKFTLDYERPPKDVLQATFENLGLRGPFWAL